MFTYFFSPFWKFTASDWFGWVFVFWRQELGWSVVFFWGLFFFVEFWWHTISSKTREKLAKLGETAVADHLGCFFTPQNPACPKRLKRWYGFRCFPVKEPNLLSKDQGMDSDGFHLIIFWSEKNMGALILPWDYLSFFVVEKFQLKMKFWDWGWSWSLFFCASPLKLDSYRPFFLFGSSSLPGWRRHSMACAAHSTHHFRPRRPDISGGGGCVDFDAIFQKKRKKKHIKFWLGVQVDHQFNVLLEGDVKGSRCSNRPSIYMMFFLEEKIKWFMFSLRAKMSLITSRCFFMNWIGWVERSVDEWFQYWSNRLQHVNDFSPNSPPNHCKKRSFASFLFTFAVPWRSVSERHHFPKKRKVG